ncbi:hypothetical protein [Parvibaculum sp.]|uniref:hypothetical protein n=1 Tax=Parvibaculum sp. TaxID=2024848 RepID=UPI00320F4642
MKFDRPTVLVLVATLLTGLVVVDRLYTSDDAPLRPERQAKSPAQNVPAVQETDRVEARSAILPPRKADDFPDIVARPLFSPDRRPAAVTNDVTEATTLGTSASMDGFDLVGLATAPNGARYAMLRRKNPDEVISVSQGKAIDGWTLRDVSARGAVFEKGGVVTTLNMARAGDVTGAATPPGAEPKDMPLRAIIPTDSMLGVGNRLQK